MEYIYLGDRNTADQLKGSACNAVRRKDGKCIRARNGNMLVSFGGRKTVVVARLLRKTVRAVNQRSGSKPHPLIPMTKYPEDRAQ